MLLSWLNIMVEIALKNLSYPSEKKCFGYCQKLIHFNNFFLTLNKYKRPYVHIYRYVDINVNVLLLYIYIY